MEMFKQHPNSGKGSLAQKVRVDGAQTTFERFWQEHSVYEPVKLIHLPAGIKKRSKGFISKSYK